MGSLSIDSLPQHPNVLFILFDDMNDLGEPGASPQTPNLDAFRKKAVLFAQNQCTAPLCNPSRCAILSGISPYRSGVFSNDQNPWQEGGVFHNVETLPECFKKNGYESIVAGKVFHTDKHFTQAQLGAMFDDYEQISGGYGPFPTDPAIPKDEIEAGDWLNYQLWTGPDSDFPDVRNTDKIVSELSITNRTKPFLMSLGLYRPHSPFTAPSRFFDMNPLKDVILPAYLENDLSDVPKIGRELAATGGGNQKKIMDGGWWRPLVRAYYACISFADWNFGRVMTALENSPYADNTIVIVCADNGLHNGEKDHWSKETLWDKSARTLLMIRVPGLSVSNSTCESAVSSIHLYPTLVDLCSLTPPHQILDGYSLRGILSDPVNHAFSFPALTSYQTGNFTLRDQRYRYIRYWDNTEEFYDHQLDPNEWTNAAGSPVYTGVKEYLQQFVPAEPAVTALVQEHFETSVNTVNSVPGWTPIAKFSDLPSIGSTSELLTGGLNYGGEMVTGITGLKLAAKDGYIHNDNPLGNNRFVKSLNKPIDFPEGTVLYFSAQIKGTKRANFGLGNSAGTSFPGALISVGINPQLSSSSESGYSELFSSSVWTGNAATAQYNDQNGVKIPENKNANYFIIGRLINNATTADEISYHIIDLGTSIHVPGVWSNSVLPGAVGYYSRSNYNFGGDLVFSNLFINLQNDSGLDEIYFSSRYQDLIPQENSGEL
ncbi:MAG: sulfatase [Kiritimatiellales bacterium]